LEEVKLIETKKTYFCLFLLIISINIYTLALSTENSESQSNRIDIDLLKSLGLNVYKKEQYHSIPRLMNSSNIISLNNPSIAFKQSEYFVPGWADTRFKYRKNITIQASMVEDDLINFPVLVDIYDSDMQNDAQASGNDIIFTDEFGYLLDHEIELFERVYNSTHAHLVAWVNMNLTSAQNTLFSLYYGNPTIQNQENLVGAWDSNYMGVWHLSETPSGSTGELLDSSSNNNAGYTSGSMDAADSVDSQMGKGLELDGIDDMIIVNESASLDLVNDEGTLSCWINWDNIEGGDYQRIMTTSNRFNGSTHNDGFEWAVNKNGHNFFYPWGGDAMDYNYVLNTTLYSNGFNSGEWHYFIVTLNYSSKNVTLYLDGIKLSLIYENVPTYWTQLANLDDWIWGSDVDHWKYFTGKFDEIRVSDIVRSDAWIQTEVNNQKNLSSFYSIGSEEKSSIIDNWNFPLFKCRKNITIDSGKISADQTNFPVLINMFDSEIIARSEVQLDGDDFLFADASGTKLNHEIELFEKYYNATHSHLVAWVRLPSLSGSSNTTITMYYGNPAVSSQENPEGVWDSTYDSVYHLSEDPTGTIYDSTVNNIDGVSGGSMTSSDQVTTQIDGGIDFDGNNDYINISSPARPNFYNDSTYTVSVWVNVDSYLGGTYPNIVSDEELDGTNGWDFYWWNDKIHVWSTTDYTNVVSSGTLKQDEWYFAAFTYSTGFVELFINGTLVDTGSAAFENSTGDFLIGVYWNESYYLDGMIDEVHISNVVRSDDWITTEWNNQYDPKSFYSVSSEETNSNWWKDGSFNKRRDLIIDKNKIAEDLTDFPILIKMIENDLKIGQVQSDGSDILFVNANGSKLVHEIESFSQNSTHGNLVAWVKIPTLQSDEDTIISMYYGNPELLSQQNPEAVWDSNYMGVWHLNNDPTGIVYDSTANNKDGTSGGSMALDDLVTAKIGEGINFDGFNDYIAFPDPLSTETMTISCWVYLDAASADWITIAMRSDGLSWFDWQLYARASDGELSNEAVFRTVYPSTSEVGSNFVLSADMWYYVVGQHNGTHNLFFTNDTLSEVDQDPNSVEDSNSDMWIGGNEVWGEFLSGILDEVRVSKIARSDGWINTQYNNQIDPSNFITVGPIVNYISDITIEETVHVGGEDVSELITPRISGVKDHLYLLSISTKPGLVDISSVSGLSLTWTELEYQASGRNQTALSIWWAQGIPTTGNVTVTLATQVQGLAISLSRISGIHSTTPFGNSETANTNGIDGASTGGTDSENATLDFTTTVNNSMILGIAATRNKDFIPNPNYLEEDEINGSSSGSEARVTTFYNYQSDYGLITVNGTNAETDWVIAGVELKPLVDKIPPVINDFGIYDPGTGTGTFWANITDLVSGVASVKIEINGSENTMSFNGSLWISQISPDFDDYYEYQIVNTTDNLGNFITSPSIVKNYTFNLDIIAPSVIDWEYYSDIGENGTFKANVTESWGAGIDTVIVNVTNHQYMSEDDLWAVMVLNGSDYINDSIFMVSGSIDFVITVNDTAGNEFTTITHSGFVPNHTPEVNNITLSRDPINHYLLPVYSNSTLYLNYSYFDIDVDAESGTEIRWYKNGVLESAYNDEIQIPSSLLFKNDEWNVTVKPKDGKDFGTLNSSVTIVIGNTPPEIMTLSVTPLTPTSSNTLSISNTTIDEDNDPIISYQIRWYINTVYNPLYDDYLSISPSNTSKGEEWFCEMRVFDGNNYSTWKQSNTVTIGNTPPTAYNLNITVNPITTNDLVAGWIYSDVDNDPQNSSWFIRWYKNDVLQPNLNDSKVVLAGNTTKGEVWYYTLQVFDSMNYSSIYTLTPSVQIRNAPPEASNLVITTDPQTNESLQANWTYSDIDGDSEANDWIIQWYKNGVHQSAYDNLKTVPSSATAKGERWNYTLQVSDGTNHSVLYNSPTTAILNTAPEASGISITTDPTSSDILVASWIASDIDNDNPDDFLNVTIIHWYIWNGTHWELQATLENSTTVGPGNTTQDEVWYYSVQIFDGEVYSQIYDSPNATVLNSIPVVTNSTFNKTSGLTTTDDFNITYSYYDADSDPEDTNKRIILWYIDGFYNSAYDNQTIIYSDNTTEGDFWQYKIRVFDGYNYSLEYTSILVIIGQGSNTPPTVTSYNITLNPVTTDDLIAEYDYYDDDGHLQVDFEIFWYCNGSLQSDLNQSLVVDHTLTAKNQEWNYSLRVFDGLNWSVQYNSDTVIILNSPPSVQEISITASPTTTINLTATWVFQDPDNDIEADYLIFWYLDGSYNSTFDNLTTIPFTATTKGEVWNYTLQVFDGENYSILYSSSAVTIRNTPPTASALTLTSNPTTTDDIVANWIYSDLDDDPQNSNWIIRWYRNGIHISNLDDTKTVSSGNTTKNEFWYFVLQVYDSENYSKSYTSPNQQIINTAPEITGPVTINPSNPVRGTALTVNYTFYDQDNDFEYGTVIRWYRNGMVQSIYNDMSTILGEAIIKGDTWYVIVNVSDGTDIGVGVNSTAIIIGNTAPQIDTVEVFPTGKVYTTNTLVANYEASDADNDIILNFTIIWKIGATPVPALENKTEVPANYTSKGQYWTYEIRVFDGTDWSDPKEPAFGVIIDNSKPTITNVILTGGSNTTDDITLSYDFIDLDNDTEDSIQTVITWYNPDLISGPTGKTLSQTYFVAGDFIFVTIIPHDGEDAGDPIITTTFPTGYVYVGNTAPEIIGNPNILGPNQSLVYSAANPLYVNYSAQDIDNDSSDIYDIELDSNGLVVGAEYRWYCNNVLVSGLTSYVVSFEYLTKGEKWIVSVRPRDRYGAFGAWVNSSEIEIGNSWPEVVSLSWQIAYPTAQTNLSFIYTYYDFDSDPEWLNQTLIQWFRNGFEIMSERNQSVLSNLEFIRGDKIYVQITVFDGKNYSIPYQSAEITILNALPIAQNISLNPSEAYTTSVLYLTWNFTDADNDLENNKTIIYWYRNGLLVTEHTNKSSLEAQYINKGEVWSVEFQIFDGLNYSILYSTANIVILNSPSSITNITINSGSNQSFADSSLIIISGQDIITNDPDLDLVIDLIIYWYKNDIYQPQYDNQTLIPSLELSKGQKWYVNISVFDGEAWSEFNLSSIIYIINKPPTVSNVEFIFDTTNSQVDPDIRDSVTEQFYVEDEDIILSYQFLDIDNDLNLTHIQWFKKAVNGSLFEEMDEYENHVTIPSIATSPGEEWYCLITPYDGYDTGSQFTSSLIVIESRPNISKPVIIPDPNNEGSYDISVEVTNQRYPIHQVIFFMNLSGSTLDFYYGINEVSNNWTIHFEMSDYSLLNTVINIEVKVISKVINSDFEIYNTTFFNLEVIDEAPPRVLNAYFQKNDDLNPTELTFFVVIEEYGLGIDEVILYYCFVPFENGGTGSGLFQEDLDWLTVPLTFESENSSGVYRYITTVEFVHNQQNMDVIYKIQTGDLEGNINPSAFDIRGHPQQMDQQRIYYQPPGLPSWILLVAGLIIVVVFMGAVVYVKFIRKPELVGLDKELVLTNIEKISEPEIIEALDEHTIGIIVSFFDQRHGPIPIIIIPEILKDNFTKLVELSDRSFSGTGFSDDFTVEIPSNYDFVLSHGVRTSIMSFGFALERPDARGGQENLTLNILIHSDLFPLIQSFQKEIQRRVHKLHILMDKDPSDKDNIRKLVFKLRKFVSAIALSYYQIYGTMELLEVDE
jgi:hypothetical protein